MPVARPSSFAPPPLPESLVTRSDADFIFSPLLRRKLCTVVAPAGYGKTTALTAFAAHHPEMPVRWLSLKTADADFQTFFRHFTDAMVSCCPPISDAMELEMHHLPVHLEAYTAALAGETTDGDAATTGGAITAFGERIAALVNERLLEDVVLVIDDVHLVQQSKAFTDFFTGFFVTQPAELHLVWLSREPLLVPTAPLLAAQQLVAIDLNDLRFSEADLQTLVQYYFPGSDEGAALRLTELCGGWIAGAVMLLEKLRTRRRLRLDALNALTALNDFNALGGTLSTSPLPAYIAGEWVSGLRRDLQEFLTATSVAEEFNVALAVRLLEMFQSLKRKPGRAAVSVASVKALIPELLYKNLLMNEASTHTYYYPQFLSGALSARLTEPEHQALRRVCGEHYRTTHPIRAAEYFIAARDTAGAIRTLVDAVTEGAGIFGTTLKRLIAEIQRLMTADAAEHHEVALDIQAQFFYLAATSEHLLNNTRGSENYLDHYRRLPHPPRTTKQGKNHITGDMMLDSHARFLHLKNLHLQCKFTESAAEGSALAKDLAKLKRFPEMQAEAMAIAVYARARLDESRASLESALQEFDRALAVVRSSSGQHQAAEPRRVIKTECTILQLRYLIAQEVSYAETITTFEIWQSHVQRRAMDTLTGLYVRTDSGLKEEIDLQTNHAFYLVANGYFVQAKPLALDILRRCDGVGYHHAFYTAKFLYAECLHAEGRFDDAMRRYDEAAEHYEPTSPSIALMILSYATVCQYFQTSTTSVSPDGSITNTVSPNSSVSLHGSGVTAAEARAVRAHLQYQRLSQPTARHTFHLEQAKYFAALASGDLASADRSIAVMETLCRDPAANFSNAAPEIALLKTHLAALKCNLDSQPFSKPAGKSHVKSGAKPRRQAGTPAASTRKAADKVAPTSTPPDVQAFLDAATAYIHLVKTEVGETPHFSLRRFWRLAQGTLLNMLAVKHSPPASLDAASHALLYSVGEPDIQRLIRHLTDFQTELGVADANGTPAAVTIQTLGAFQLSRPQRAASPVPKSPSPSAVRMPVSFGMPASGTVMGNAVMSGAAMSGIITSSTVKRRPVKLLLMLLLTRHKETVLFETVGEHLWPDSERANQDIMMRSTVSAIRRLLLDTGLCDTETDVLLRTEIGYRLDFGIPVLNYIYDAERAEDALTQARTGSTPAKAAAHYQTVIDLYGGAFLDDARYEPWAAYRRVRLEDGYVEALLFIATRHADAKRYAAAVELCEKVIALRPVHVPAYELLIRAYQDRHLFAEALNAFRRCKESFRVEQNTYPPVSLERRVMAELSRHTNGK
jgi:DNA-binding SARP family transcriptional activator